MIVTGLVTLTFVVLQPRDVQVGPARRRVTSRRATTARFATSPAHDEVFQNPVYVIGYVICMVLILSCTSGTGCRARCSRCA